MLNYQIKNLNNILNPSDGERTLITGDNDMGEIIIVGGQVCNVYRDFNAFFNLFIQDQITNDRTYIYKNIKIEGSNYLPINKFSLKLNQSLKVSCTLEHIDDYVGYLLYDEDDYLTLDGDKLIVTEGNEVDLGLHISLNYFNTINYDYGFIKVTFNPPLVFNQEPVSLEPYQPQWRITNTATWNAETSNADYIPLDDGDYEIEFSNISGFQTPSNVEIKIVKLKLTELIVTYEILEAIVNVKCNQIDLAPDFGWRLAGGSGDYFNSNQYVIVPHGATEIEFKTITGVTKPTNISFVAVQKEIHFFTVEYTRPTGYLTVNINPPYIRFGKSHKINFEWYVIFPDYWPTTHFGSSTKLYNSGVRLPLPPTNSSSGEMYELVLESVFIHDRCFLQPVNQFFTLAENQELVINVNMIETSCFGVPDDTILSVVCPNNAIDPGNPGYIIENDNLLKATLVGYVDTPNPVTCEGTRVWTYRYNDYITNELIKYWTYTYNITYSGGLTTPPNSVETITCVSEATVPNQIATIHDACGRNITPVLVGYVDTPNLITCEGTRVYTYRYTSCDGSETADWTYTYNVTYSGELIAPENTTSEVNSLESATDPGLPISITDTCGRSITPVLIGYVDTPDPIVGSGTRVYTYRYTSCDGSETADWTHTYTVELISELDGLYLASDSIPLTSTLTPTTLLTDGDYENSPTGVWNIDDAVGIDFQTQTNVTKLRFYTKLSSGSNGGYGWGSTNQSNIAFYKSNNNSTWELICNKVCYDYTLPVLTYEEGHFNFEVDFISSQSARYFKAVPFSADGYKPWCTYYSNLDPGFMSELLVTEIAKVEYVENDDENTVLLIHMDNGYAPHIFIDSSSLHHTIYSNGNVKTVNTNYKFTPKSAYFDGIGDYLSIADHTSWDFGSGDFTIDFWYYSNLDSEDNELTIGHAASYNVNNNWTLYVKKSHFGMIFNNWTYSARVIPTTLIPQGQWAHLAVVRNGDVLTYYLNGSSVGSFTLSSSYVIPNTNPSLKIGVIDTSTFNNDWNGYIDEFRISKGIARWTSNFTLPTEVY